MFFIHSSVVTRSLSLVATLTSCTHYHSSSITLTRLSLSFLSFSLVYFYVLLDLILFYHHNIVLPSCRLSHLRPRTAFSTVYFFSFAKEYLFLLHHRGDKRGFLCQKNILKYSICFFLFPFHSIPFYSILSTFFSSLFFFFFSSTKKLKFNRFDCSTLIV